jgi:hypothetical protein
MIVNHLDKKSHQIISRLAIFEILLHLTVIFKYQNIFF